MAQDSESGAIAEPLNCKPSQMKNPTGGKLKPKQKWQMPAPWPEPACGPNKKKSKKKKWRRGFKDYK